MVDVNIFKESIGSKLVHNGSWGEGGAGVARPRQTLASQMSEVPLTRRKHVMHGVG